MILDYNQRQSVRLNRPRKQQTGMFLLGFLLTASFFFALGMLTGWFAFKSRQQDASLSQVTRKPQTAPPVGVANKPSEKFPAGTVMVPKPADQPLSFYNALPHGEKVMGSGINTTKQQAPSPGVPASSGNIHPASTQPVRQPEASKNIPTVHPGSKSVEQAAGKDAVAMGKPAAVAPSSIETKTKNEILPKNGYCVQVASYAEKKPAEELKARLMTAGFTPYVIMSEVTGKGKWYRVRVGRHLDPPAAKEIAARLGKSAILVME